MLEEIVRILAILSSICGLLGEIVVWNADAKGNLENEGKGALMVVIGLGSFLVLTIIYIIVKKG